MKKFWVVHNIPSPYRLHIFNALWKECKERDLDFHVHFMCDMSRGYEERPISWRNPKVDFPYTYWRDYGFGQRHINPGILSHIKKNQPEYLLAGSPFDTLTGMLVGRVVKGVTCTWCEGNTKTTGKMDGVIGEIKRFALRGYDYVAVPGSDAIKYIDLHQARTRSKMPTPIYLPNLIDEKRFKPKEEWDKNELLELRNKLGIDKDDLVALTPARLTAVKGLVEYFQKLTPQLLQGWKLLLFGQGELREQLLKIAAENSFDKNLIVKDFISYDEMPKVYAMSDVMILPSNYDPNPLSVVEALHSGLPVALSCMAGNVEEAITEGRNGWVLPIKDDVLYREKLREIFSTKIERLREMGCLSFKENAQFWNTKQAVRTFLRKIGVI